MRAMSCEPKSLSNAFSPTSMGSLRNAGVFPPRFAGSRGVKLAEQLVEGIKQLSELASSTNPQ